MNTSRTNERTGVLIVLDGQDSTGKETQKNKLVLRLQQEGFTVSAFSFPRYTTPTGKIVREILDGKYGDLSHFPPLIISLYYAADRLAAKKELDDLLAAGHVVISDRYVTANLGHQGSRITHSKERAEYTDKITALEYSILELPIPDLTILLRVPVEVSIALMLKRAAEKNRPLDQLESDYAHLRAAANTFTELAKKLPKLQAVECCSPGAVHAEDMLDADTIHALVWEAIQPCLAQQKSAALALE